MLCTNGSAGNPYGQCNKSLTPRQDLISEHPEWFFPHPSNCTADPGRLFCIEQGGGIVILPKAKSGKERIEFFNINDRKPWVENEEGLLGLAFHPNFKSNQKFYVYYSQQDPKRSVVSEFTVSKSDKNKADMKSERILLEFPQPYWNHNGGVMLFGKDGKLYISSGDGGKANDPHDNAQNLNNLLGKILRIDVDSRSGNLQYGIPADNPWTAAADPQDQILDELWAIGPRNPWGVSFDPRNGDLYIGDVGGEPTADSHEEVTYVAADATTGLTPAGMNFEWSIMEGFKVNYPDEVDSFGPGVRVGPIYDYERGNNTFPDGASVTGGVVYWGCALPDLRGTYFFGDWTAHWIASMRVDADGALTAPPS